VGGVIEELAHDLSPRPRIATPLDLDERGNAVLVQEEMIERPARACVVGNAHLPVDQEPPPRLLEIDLIARQQPGIPGEKSLEIDLGGKRRLRHLRKATVRVEKKNATGHGASL
jgi:hypothetical protein